MFLSSPSWWLFGIQATFTLELLFPSGISNLILSTAAKESQDLRKEPRVHSNMQYAWLGKHDTKGKGMPFLAWCPYKYSRLRGCRFSPGTHINTLGWGERWWYKGEEEMVRSLLWTQVNNDWISLFEKWLYAPIYDKSMKISYSFFLSLGGRGLLLRRHYDRCWLIHWLTWVKRRS